MKIIGEVYCTASSAVAVNPSQEREKKKQVGNPFLSIQSFIKKLKFTFGLHAGHTIACKDTVPGLSYIIYSLPSTGVCLYL